MISDLQRKWKTTINEVQSQLSNLLQQRHWMNRINVMVRSNPELRHQLLLDLRAWYAAFAIMAVRRQSDDDNRSVSLRRMLGQMKANPPVLSGLSPMGSIISVDSIEVDIQRLAAVSEKILRIADKEIAHPERGGARFEGDERRPNFNDLDACIDEYADVAKKYVLLLTGGAMSSLEPTEQFEWSPPFRTPWIVECAGCGHSALFHDGKSCNGWVEEYHQRQAAGNFEMPPICGCTLTQADVFRQAGATEELSLD